MDYTIVNQIKTAVENGNVDDVVSYIDQYYSRFDKDTLIAVKEILLESNSEKIRVLARGL